MCRYAMCGPYKSHFVCFPCRKAFKKLAIEEWFRLNEKTALYDRLKFLDRYHPSNKVPAARLTAKEAVLGITLKELEAEYYHNTLCPECKQPMTDMGLDFKAPRQTNKKAWLIAQGLVRLGHCFHTCGCNGPGYIPASTSDYRQYLRQRQQEYQHELKRYHDLGDYEAHDRLERAAYWQERLDKIAVVMKTLG